MTFPSSRGHRLLACVSVAICSSAAPATSHAQVLYSNFGPGDSYSTGFTPATFAGYGKSAARFIPTTGGTFDRVETALSRQGGISPVTASVSITTETTQTSGPPGGIPAILPVWCATTASGPVDARAIMTFTGPRATLTAGQAYWIVIEATDGTSWFMTSPPILGTTAFKNGSPTWFTTPSTPLPAFRVSLSGATPGLGACCNGATVGCTLVEQSACTALGLTFAGAGVTCAAGPACAACPADFNHTAGVSLQDLFDYLTAWFAGCP